MIKVVTAYWMGAGEAAKRRVQTFKIDADTMEIRGKGDLGEPNVLALLKEGQTVAVFATWNHAIALPDSTDAEGDSGDAGA